MEIGRNRPAIDQCFLLTGDAAGDKQRSASGGLIERGSGYMTEQTAAIEMNPDSPRAQTCLISLRGDLFRLPGYAESGDKGSPLSAYRDKVSDLHRRILAV